MTGDGPSPLLYVNPREGKYPEQPLYEGAKMPPTVGVAVLDYNKDGWMDIAVTHAGAPGLTLWRNVEARIASGGALNGFRCRLGGSAWMGFDAHRY